MPPWAGKRLPEIMMNVAMKRKHPPIPGDLPAELQATLRGCFVHDQTSRHSAEDVLRPMVAPQPAAGQKAAAGAHGGDLQFLRTEFEQRFATQEAQIAQLQAVNVQLQGQVVAMAQQMADQVVQMTRQITDGQKDAERKLGKLDREMQLSNLEPPRYEDTVAKISAFDQQLRQVQEKLESEIDNHHKYFFMQIIQLNKMISDGLAGDAHRLNDIDTKFTERCSSMQRDLEQQIESSQAEVASDLSRSVAISEAALKQVEEMQRQLEPEPESGEE